MTDDFGTPETQVNPPKKNNTWTIIIVALVLLCCCCTLVALGLAWNYGDAVMRWLGVY